MRKYVFVILTMVLVITAVSFTFGETKEQIKPVHYESIQLVSGDTLWSIAEEYKTDGFSTAGYVAVIKDFNNMKNDNIIAGQKIIVPVR